MAPKADRFDRRATDANLASLSTRVDAIEGRMDSFETSLRTTTAELQANTRLTEEIHKDTSDLVEFTKFAKTGIKYGSAIAAAVATVGGIGKVFGAW